MNHPFGPEPDSRQRGGDGRTQTRSALHAGPVMVLSGPDRNVLLQAPDYYHRVRAVEPCSGAEAE